MMRIGFLPSDFNPMVLMLGEAEDLRLLAAVLRRFAREQIFRVGLQIIYYPVGFQLHNRLISLYLYFFQVLYLAR